MDERRFKNFLYSMIAIILMIAFMGLAGGSFLNIKAQDKMKIDQIKTRKTIRPVQFKKMIEIEKIETKHLLISY